MASFEFRDRSIPVEIRGERHTIKCDAESVKAVQTLSAQFSGLDSEDQKAQLEKLVELVDAVLGPGAVKTIFSDRPLNLLDLTDLVDFLAKEISAENRRNERAARRAAAKRKE